MLHHWNNHWPRVPCISFTFQGVEMAIMANDACGAPIPFEICLPTFFDGKLFHFKLRRAASARNLMELCDGRVEMARQVRTPYVPFST